MTGDAENKKSSRRRASAAAPDEQLVTLVGSLPSPAEFAKSVLEAVPSAQPFSVYLNEIARFPVLSESEELALVKKAQENKNDRATRRELNEANIRLVTWIAKEYASGDTPLSDLINEGTLGLNNAINTFKPESGTSFRLHAANAVRQVISEAVAYETTLNRVPDYLLEKVTSIKPVSVRLMNQMGREPTRDEVAEELGLSADELDRLVKLVGHAPGNEETGEDEQQDDELPGDDFYDIDQDYD